jgi:hypothetical protein
LITAVDRRGSHKVAAFRGFLRETITERPLFRPVY